eukprot:5877453-Prymnesium_polylepis.1
MSIRRSGCRCEWVVLPNSVAGREKGAEWRISGLPNDTFAKTPRVSLGRRPTATLEVPATVPFGVPPFRSRALPRTLEEAV